MQMQQKIEAIQKQLRGQEADGWLLYDNHGSNQFVRKILEIDPRQVLTRRFFYWIPKEGEPQKILHRIEAESLNHLPGKTSTYFSWIDLQSALKQVLKNEHTLLMEYSPKAANPSLSVLDAGTFEMLRELGLEIKSSADLLQNFTSVLDKEQIESHLEAAVVVEGAVAKAWDFIADSLAKKRAITEFSVQEFILREFAAHKCLTEEGPCCSVNEHSALPHYSATEKESKTIHKGDFILIDLWCKKEGLRSVYADITRVAVADSVPTPKQQKIFDIVFLAQKKGIDFVIQQFKEGKIVKGFEVDDVCRSVIKAAGFGDLFAHRTGHNIDTLLHGSGANFDNLETSDQRQLLPGMCFSVEPGIYLKGEFGIRLESNLLIRENSTVEVTGGKEERLLCLL